MDATTSEEMARTVSAPVPFSRTAGVLEALRDLPVVPTLILLMFILCALFAEHIAPHDPYHFEPRDHLMPPSWCEGGSPEYILGTDGVGRDILSRVIYGSRISITVAAYVIGISATFGILLGLIAGFFRGLVDTILMRLVEIMQGMPSLLFILALAHIMPRGLTTVVTVMCVFGWPGYTRIIRGVVLSLREKDFIALARVARAGPIRIMLRHILPNLINIITVLVTLEIGGLILAEAGLSFIGVGIPPPTPSWGTCRSGMS